MNSVRLSDKVAIVSGAGRGLGRAIACLFAQEGAKVVVAEIVRATGEQTAAAIQAAGGQAFFTEMDVTRPDQWRDVVEATVQRYGKLDILVNNAAVLRWSNVVDDSIEDFERIVSVNLRGTFLGCKYAIPQMIAAGKGSIVNVASAAAVRGFVHLASYSASKGAILPLTQSIAKTYGAQGVRCNAVCPGGMDTEMIREFQAENVRRGIQAPRPTDPGFPQEPTGKGTEEVARSVLFLASDEAAYINGATLVVDGGMTA